MPFFIKLSDGNVHNFPSFSLAGDSIIIKFEMMIVTPVTMK